MIRPEGSVDETLRRLQEEVASLKARQAHAEAQSLCLRRRARLQTGLALAVVAASILVSPANRAAIAQGYGVTLQSLDTRLKAVEAKTQFMSTDTTAKRTTFSGCNLFVNDGGGYTGAMVTNAAGEGLGNVIVGYNSTGHRLGPDVRTGCHNLIVGDDNNYSSFGGLAAGRFSDISGIYTTVTGGYGNNATSDYAAVSGGYNNTASAHSSVVSGGYFNAATGIESVVSGGVGVTTVGSGVWAAGSYHTP